MTMCVCGSLLPEEKCCLQYIDGGENPPTALALMRSRYTAFAKGKIDYLYNTYVEEWRQTHPYEAFQNSFQQVTWKELEIVGVEHGGIKEEQGEVEFVAHYQYRGAELSLHERSSFRREDGAWRYIGGVFE
jgi:SEC-C motif-containing protein